MPSCSIIILLNILEWYSYGTAVVNTEMFVPEYILRVWYMVANEQLLAASMHTRT